MDNINNIIHQPIRLKIMTLLHMDKSATFSRLKKELKLSDWNLWAHLEKLEKEEYIKINKSFIDKKPLSTITIEKKWENELISYIQTIQNIFNSIK